MILAGTIVSQVAALIGVLAGGVALGGFLAHAGPALRGADEVELRRATAWGGLGGLGATIGVVVLPAFFDKVIS